MRGDVNSSRSENQWRYENRPCLHVTSFMRLISLYLMFRNKFDCSLFRDMRRLSYFHCTSTFHCGLKSHTCLHDRCETHNCSETRGGVKHSFHMTLGTDMRFHITMESHCVT